MSRVFIVAAENRAASRSCSLLFAGSLSALPHEALSQKSVTNRSVHPQKFITTALRDDVPDVSEAAGREETGIS